MENTTTLTCDVTSDLMVLYTTGKTSRETGRMVEDHLHTCAACAQAFAREPHVRERIEKPKAYEPTELDNFFEWLQYYLLPVWGFMLYLLSRLLNGLDRVFRRFGRTTTNLKIKVYRARRKVAGRQVDHPSAQQAVI